MGKHLISRRTVLTRTLLGTTGGAAALLLAACQQAPAPKATTASAQPTTAPQPTTASAATSATSAPAPTSAPAESTTPVASTAPATTSGQYKEAPSLAAQVKAGKLPPVEQRLPKNPMVITPIDKVGQYGGTWHSAMLGTADTPWFERTIGYEAPDRWDVDWKNLVPDICSKWDVSPDGTEFTWYLREGLKWSDGVPATADDLVFWYNDVLLNKDITPTIPDWFKVGGEPGKIEKVDDHTFKMTFSKPAGLLLKDLAMLGTGMFWPQAKYAKQYHIKYNKDAVEKMVNDQKLSDWATLYNKMVGTTVGLGRANWYNANVPCLYPWVVTQPLGKGTHVIAQRNPYYWKVDTQGNQLPYLDTYDSEVVAKADVMVLKALNGEIDMQARTIATNANKAAFVQHESKGKYHFFTLKSDSMNTFIVLFNFNHKDPVLRKIFQDINFRIGLSYALNRKDIINTVYFSQGEPWQAAPLKESNFYNEKLASQYLDYDVDKANQYLDKAGLTKKDANGIRLRPDGKPLSFTFESTSGWIDTLGLVKKQWKAVGVDILVKSEDRSLRATRMLGAEHDVTCWGGDGGMDAILGPYWYMAYASFNCFAPLWALWWESGGKKGEEPNAPAKKQQQLYDQIRTTADLNKQKDLMNQILDIAQQQFWIIGCNTPSVGYGIVKNDFMNVPKEMWSSGQEYTNPGASMPEQYFIDKNA